MPGTEQNKDAAKSHALQVTLPELLNVKARAVLIYPDPSRLC